MEHEGDPMAIKLEFCNVIVPVKSIRDKLGDEAFEKRFSAITDLTWNDGHLFRDGCMNRFDLKEMLDGWQSSGFELFTEVDGAKRWKELCVVNTGHGPSYPGDWIEYDAAANVVWLKGKDPGDAVGPAGRNVASET